MINTTDEPEVNEEAQLPPVVPDSEIPRSRTPPSVPPDQTTANAETLREPTNAEIPPEPKAEPTQGAEHAQPVDQPAVNRPRRERQTGIPEGLSASLATRTLFYLV